MGTITWAQAGATRLERSDDGKAVCLTGDARSRFFDRGAGAARAKR